MEWAWLLSTLWQTFLSLFWFIPDIFTIGFSAAWTILLAKISFLEFLWVAVPILCFVPIWVPISLIFGIVAGIVTYVVWLIV